MVHPFLSFSGCTAKGMLLGGVREVVDSASHCAPHTEPVFIALWPPSRGKVRFAALDTSMLWLETQSSRQVQS